MEQNKVKLVSENLIFDLQNELIQKPYFNEVDESGVINTVESPYYYRILDKIIKSVNNTLNE